MRFNENKTPIRSGLNNNVMLMHIHSGIKQPIMYNIFRRGGYTMFIFA
jgi:hypothetical protein